MFWALILLTAAVVALLVTVLMLALRVRQREAEIRRLYPPIGQLITVAGRRVHTLTMGAGPDVVLIHGASGQLRDLLDLMQHLAPRFRVTAFDRPGLGYSDSLGLKGVAPGAQARHLAEAAGQLGITHPIVLGQSYGGTVALGWALHVTDTLAAAALVLVSAPSLPWAGKLDWWYQLNNTWAGRMIGPALATALVTDGYLESLIPGLFAPNPEPPGYAKATGAALALPRRNIEANALQVNGLYGQVVAMQGQYPGLTLPVELLHGAADTIVPPHIHSERLVGIIASSRLTLLPDAGHMPHHTHVEAVVDAVVRAADRASERAAELAALSTGWT